MNETTTTTPGKSLECLIFEAATAGAYLCGDDLGSRRALLLWLRQELAWTGDLPTGQYQKLIQSTLLQPWQRPDHPHNRLARFIRRQAGYELDGHCALHHDEP